ncbi:hypothetical protein T440DRAFT_535579 [Plenodomus tracheiphilus IPT5]|uniref:Uncharacterized protein n=1 Tax=Plenodomus tracheiphilus IPT5 TaxID=1408161 RepID=A0A6A7BJB2_9PLEO|nr:hypothetical protein T440DRAFT_535579 [Plenodomus tracheiphilus IPT5]
MYYLVLTTHHDRPYPCKVAFVARDFELWGCRVDRYPDDSPYIAEIRGREARGNPKEMRRIDLMEIWAREVISRKRQIQPSPVERRVSDEHLSEENWRYARASSLVQDFIRGLAAFENPGSKDISPLVDPRPVPESPYVLYDDAGTRDPVPLYERVEHPPAYIPAQ